MSWWLNLTREAFSQQAAKEQPRMTKAKPLAILADTKGGAIEQHHRKAKKRRQRKGDAE